MRVLVVVLMVFAATPSLAQESRRYVEREHFRSRNVPNPLDLIEAGSEVGVIRHWVFGALFCSAGNLMYDTLLAQRELLLHEAWEIVAGCTLPILGRAIVHRIFFDHPEWDRLPTGPRYTYNFQLEIR